MNRAALPTGGFLARSLGLDIVRALAILLVLLSHYGTYFAAWLGVGFPFILAAAGFFGVELFFVLSGFLIGRLLIGLLDQGPGWRDWLIFMVRRWMRTLPLYFVCLAFLALVGPAWRDLPWFISISQNLAWRMVDDRFAVSWSLTVEEWFYVLFSGLLFAACALAGRRAAFWGVTALFLVLPAVLRWRLPAGVDWDQVTSKVVIYRLDAIAYGVLAAWAHMRRGALLRHPIWLLGVGVLVIALFWGGVLDRTLAPSAHVRKTFMFNVASVGFALWLPAAARFPQHLHRVPAFFVRVVSQQSYAMYLVHLTLIEYVNLYRQRFHVSAPLAILTTLAALLSLTTLSYYGLERPILALRPRQRVAGPEDAVR